MNLTLPRLPGSPFLHLRPLLLLLLLLLQLLPLQLLLSEAEHLRTSLLPRQHSFALRKLTLPWHYPPGMRCEVLVPTVPLERPTAQVFGNRGLQLLLRWPHLWWRCNRYVLWAAAPQLH